MPRQNKTIHYRVFGATDKGKVRPANEDAFLIKKEEGFFAVADGMGGHSGGDVASKMAVDSGQKAVRELFAPHQEEDTWPDQSPQISDEERMRQILQKAGKVLSEKNVAKEGRQKMGTTFVCLKMQGHKVYVANTGDSRCYLIRNGNIQQLTMDHSMAEEMIQSGSAHVGDKNLKQIKNYITSCLGTKSDMEIDVIVSLPKIHDCYLLCSDGLTKMLSDEKICHIVFSEKNIQKACDQLILMANEMGGKDNITVVLIEVMGVETAAGRQRTGTKKKMEEGEETLI